jgi:ribosomal protein L11
VLLDALEALAPHGRAVIVAGAQAVYLHTGLSEIGIAPYTTDGDLALDPALLRDEPQLEAAMRAARFRPDLREPGIWLASVTVDGDELTIPVDLIVPEGAASGAGRRGARLGPHGRRAARRAVGLEAALVDHSSMNVAALEVADTRSFEVEVAGPAALLVAKAHKIHDRLASSRPGRLDDKDAADVYRLMQATSPIEIAERLAELRRHEIAGPATEAAITYLAELFGRRNGEGVRMATRALRLAIPEAQVSTLATSYIERMAGALER